MYYPCSENKDADQLRGYRKADLRLCFRPCKLLVFSRTGSYMVYLGGYTHKELFGFHPNVGKKSHKMEATSRHDSSC